MRSKNITPEKIWKEYENGVSYKGSLGDKGLYEQSKRNERFYIGDQWRGAQCGADRPLVRHNVIKRIGDYKQAIIGSSPLSVSFSAEGVPDIKATRDATASIRKQAPELLGKGGNPLENMDRMQELDFITGVMSDYCTTTMERLKFNNIKDKALRKAYLSGTAIVYTYWDEDINTGLYVDEAQTRSIKGDIRCEVLDIENFYVGNPNEEDIQRQPYIIIEQRRSVEDVKREMKRLRRPQADIDKVKADEDIENLAGDYGSQVLEGDKKCTVLTKYYKHHNDDGTYKVMAVRVCKGVIVRPEWDTKLDVYPFASFVWEQRSNCFYGESEVTWLIPNQIAINRMLTAAVWAVMINGMPILIKDGDRIPQDISNDPGQVIDAINLNGQGVSGALQYVVPPAFYAQFDNMAQSIINNTLAQSGANDAALGNVNPDNTSAIIAVREAATMPMTMFSNRFYQFVEDIARVWASFWLNMYGKRSLKVTDRQGTWYMPFDANNYKNLMLSVKVDVGASTLWSEAQSIATLDNLFGKQVIDVLQYLERLPKGVVPNISGLIEEVKAANEAAAQATQTPATPTDMQTPPTTAAMNPQNILAGLSPEARAKFDNLSPEEQKQLLDNAMKRGAEI